MNKLCKISPELLHAVNLAGERLLSLWPGNLHSGIAEPLIIEKKSDGTLVSQADTESNRILIEALTRLSPQDTILSEESPIDRAAIHNARRIWVIDPLDGTSSFVHGRDDFSVLIALCEDLVPTLGIMFFPARGLLVTAERGQQALCNGCAISVSNERVLRPGRVYIRNFESLRPELASPMMDSGLALLKVATGELDGAIIRMTTHREWDIAAPAAVLLSAGGCYSSETGDPVRLGVGDVEFAYFIASNGLVHEQLQALMP